MRHLVASCLLLASCSDPAPAGTGSTASAGGDASQGGSGGTGPASVGSGSTSVTIASASSSGGSGGEGGATSSASSTSSSVTTTTATTGTGGGCAMPACFTADVDCDPVCGSTCDSLVCTNLATHAVTPGNSVSIHIPPVTEQHPACAANCDTGIRWAMRVRITDGAACVAVVAPDGILWTVSGSSPSPACFASLECGEGQFHPDDGIQRWVTVGVPEGVDVPSAVVTIHVTDGIGGCTDDVMDGFAAECEAVGCNGVGG